MSKDIQFQVTVTVNDPFDAMVIGFVARLLEGRRRSDYADLGVWDADCMTTLIEGIRDSLISPEWVVATAYDPEELRPVGAISRNIADIVEKANAYSEEQQNKIRAQYRQTGDVPPGSEPNAI